IKLDSVASDILGVSGRAMLQALCEGTSDPELLAELARGQLRRKIPALREAVAGRFRADHALVVGHILAHLEFLDETIATLSGAIEEAMVPFRGGARAASDDPRRGPAYGRGDPPEGRRRERRGAGGGDPGHR